MANEVTVDPRYMKYDKDEMDSILASVEHFDNSPTENSDNPVKSGGVATAIKQAVQNIPKASEENVRNIVKNWMSEPEPEEEEES